MKTKYKTISVQIPEELHRKLKKQTERNCSKSIAATVRHTLETHFRLMAYEASRTTHDEA